MPNFSLPIGEKIMEHRANCFPALALALLFFSANALAADWTLIYEHSEGVKWYGTPAEKLSDGILRLYVKPIHPKRSPEPIAILLDCKKKRFRNYVAGQFGTEFFEPWQPIVPDSISEISSNWYCKK